jgi:hypothetical protein
VTLVVGCLADFGSARIENTAANMNPSMNISAASLVTESAMTPQPTAMLPAVAPQPASMLNDPSGQTDVTMAEPSVTGAVAAVVPDRPEPVVETVSATAPELTPAELTPTESAPVQLAMANPSDKVIDDAGTSLNSVEIADECLVVEICVDRYLWTLYQRTPKEDTNKERERRKVSVKKKGRIVTVTKTFIKLVDADFTWKDPKAAEKAGMPMMDYVIGGMDPSFKLKLYHALRAAEAAGLSPGITSAFRDDYRQSIASGLKAASNRSYHGGSSRGGYGHGLAADIVGVQGGDRNQRWAASERLWKWVDAHGKEFGIGRPYLGRDPPHVAPVDGREYAAHNRGSRHAGSDVKKVKRLVVRDDQSLAKRPRAAASSRTRTI